MKKSFCALLLCSSFIISNAQAAAAPILFKALAVNSFRILGATAALGPSIMTVTIVGTVAAIGEADEKRNKEGINRDLTLTDIAHGWLYQYERVKKGYLVCEVAVMKAIQETNNQNKDRDEIPPAPITSSSEEPPTLVSS